MRLSAKKTKDIVMNITHYTWNDAKMPPAAIFSQPGSQITRKNRNITIDFSGFLQKN